MSKSLNILDSAKIQYWDDIAKGIRYIEFIGNKKTLTIRRFVEICTKYCSEKYPIKRDNYWEVPLEVAPFIIEDILEDYPNKSQNIPPTQNKPYNKNKVNNMTETQNKNQSQSKGLSTGVESAFEKLKAESPEIFHEGGFYNVRGKKIPDSRKLSETTNLLADKGIIILNTEILECGKDRDKSFARVRCINKNTGQYQEGFVVHHYDTLKDVYLLDMIQSAEDGKIPNPIDKVVGGIFLLTQVAERQLAIRIMNFKKFAERDAATKAARIAQDKMLNRDWRTLDEINSENEEIERVNKK